jgi:hypothetical protein
MRSTPPAALLALALAAGCAHRTPAPAQAGPPGVRLAVEVGERGEVVFLVPAGWKATNGEPEPPLPSSVRFEPPLGHFALIVTPIPGPGEVNDPVGPDVARVLVEAARDRALDGAVERQLPLVALETPGLRGWYFAVTDRELAEAGVPAGPDDYRCLVQGAVVVGPLVLAFSLLDDGAGPDREVALALVRGALHRPPPPPRPAEPASEPPGRRHADPSGWSLRGAEPLELALPGRAWSLLLDLEGWKVADPRRRFDGSGVTVIGQRREDGLLFSASLVEAAGLRSAESCRERDWGRMAKVEGLTSSRLEVTAGEARAWYTVSEEAGPSRHLSAWRYRDGACLHLHLSLPVAEPGAEARLQQGLGVARYGEAL